MTTNGTGKKRKGVSRRVFLAGTGGGAILAGAGVYAYSSCSTPPLAGQVVNAWVSVTDAGDFQVVCPAQEIGQGATTALPMIVAEEMGADLARVTAVAAPRDPGTYGNPDFAGRMVTADSKTTSGYFDLLRRAGAEARLALTEAAAGLRGWDPKDCTARGHAIHHAPSGAQIGFADIVQSASLRPPAALGESDLKPRAAYTLIGTSSASPDLIAMVTGRKAFGIDRRSPDALVAVLARSPHLGGTPVTVDDSAARAVAGVRDVVILDDAVAVAADDTWSAIKARDSLEISWSEPEPFDSAAERAALEQALAEDIAPATVVRSAGEPERAPADAPIRVRETFYAPCVSHLAQEPLNAEVRGTSLGLGASVTSSTQSLDLDMRYGARTWKTAPFMVENRGTPCGGAFGRRVLNDTVRDAALVAKAIGKPVQVVRPLADELRRGQVRPAALQTVEATADADGNLVSWVHRIASDSVLNTHLPSSLEDKPGGFDNTAIDGARHGYRVQNEVIAWQHVPSRPVPGFLRGVAAGYTVWAIETVADRIARASGRDPLEWRLAHIGDARLARVVETVAREARWTARDAPRHARGLACMTFRGAAVATVAEVSSRGDGVRVDRLWISADVGLAIHPKNVEAQIEGAALFGLSLALEEELTFSNGAADAGFFADYPVLGADRAPDIRVTLVGTREATRPAGAGEIGVPTVAPAVGNALARLHGVSPTSLPFGNSSA